jgi:hypothetical protein
MFNDRVWCIFHAYSDPFLDARIAADKILYFFRFLPVVRLCLIGGTGVVISDHPGGEGRYDPKDTKWGGGRAGVQAVLEFVFDDGHLIVNFGTIPTKRTAVSTVYIHNTHVYTSIKEWPLLDGGRLITKRGTQLYQN